MITTNHPKEYMILGADAIIENSATLSNLITDRILLESGHKTNRHTIAQVCQETILERYNHMFDTEINPEKECQTIQHKIYTEDCQPICLPNIQIPRYWEDEIDAEIKKLLKSGVIKHSSSAWGARIVPVKKKTGEIRMCVDYRKLNEVTKKDSYPLPRISEILDELGKA